MDSFPLNAFPPMMIVWEIPSCRYVVRVVGVSQEKRKEWQGYICERGRPERALESPPSNTSTAWSGHNHFWILSAVGHDSGTGRFTKPFFQFPRPLITFRLTCKWRSTHHLEPHLRVTSCTSRQKTFWAIFFSCLLHYQAGIMSKYAPHSRSQPRASPYTKCQKCLGTGEYIVVLPAVIFFDGQCVP